MTDKDPQELAASLDIIANQLQKYDEDVTLTSVSDAIQIIKESATILRRLKRFPTYRSDAPTWEHAYGILSIGQKVEITSWINLAPDELIERLSRDTIHRLNRCLSNPYNEEGYMHFTMQRCYCGRDHLEENRRAYATGINITGCPSCHRSYCD